MLRDVYSGSGGVDGEGKDERVEVGPSKALTYLR